MCKSIFILGMLATALALQAQTPLATVTSSAPFSLRGAAISPGSGVPTWPVFAGDTVKAGGALTIVTYPDGTVIALAPGSEGKIDFVNGKPTFELVSGSAKYSRKRTGVVVFMTGGNEVAMVGLTGTLALGGATAAAVGLTAGAITAIAVGGAAGAAALAVGVHHLVSGGSTVSPSQ